MGTTTNRPFHLIIPLPQIDTLNKYHYFDLTIKILTNQTFVKISLKMFWGRMVINNCFNVQMTFHVWNYSPNENNFHMTEDMNLGRNLEIRGEDAWWMKLILLIKEKNMCVGRLQVNLCTTLVSLSSQMRQPEKSGQTLLGTPALDQTVKILF